MESGVRDTTDQSMESSGSDIRPVVEEQSVGLDNFDAQEGGLENVGFSGVAYSSAGDIVTGGRSEDTKDEVKQPVSGILDKSNAQNGSTGETMLRMDGESSSGERLQTGKAPQLDSRNVKHDHASHNSTESWAVGYGFEMGDMVWGKVKSHPWWPGHIFNEAFASPSVRRTKKDGQVLVAFFGDSSYGWFDPTELIPYEPHFNEKSQQSTSRNFVKAVEESVDEACRRSALGLTCFCRNPHNFRPTNVQGHMAVDVFDYEPGGIYSHDQIQKARDNFQPQQTLSFIEQLAAAPGKATVSLDFVREKAIAVGFRRAVFEEFDETYAQAFGQEPVRPTVAPPPSVDQSVQANLSGPLVIAESLSGHRSSTKTVKSKEHSKKDRYLFKRRDEPGDVGNFRVGQKHSSSSSFASEDQQSHATAGDYVFQKRDQLQGAKDAVTGAGKEEARHPMPSTDQERAIVKDTGAAKESVPPSTKSKKLGVLKGALKRSSAEKSDLREKKKKRKTTDSLGSSGKGELQGKPIQISAPSRTESQPKAISAASASQQVPVVPSGAVNEESKLQRVLADLKVLARNPLHGKERNRTALARQVFLRFRSLVFQKSLPALPGDKEAFEARSVKTASDHPLRPPKPLVRTDDPTKGARKRVPSERQGDNAAKRAKKLSAVKSSTEKRKAPETQHPDGKGKGVAAGQLRIGAKTEPSVKAQPTKTKTRVKEPTFLVMKFPPGTSLPSSAELKARFGRFGPMDPSQNRVFYTTNMCRILFLYKEDAESAYRFASGKNSPFSSGRFMLKPLSVAPDSQAAGRPSKTGDEISGDHLQPTPPTMQPSPAVQLKSCLKKPTGDEGGGQTSGGVRGARVRFNMGAPMTDPRAKNSSSLPESSSSLSVATDVRNNQQKVFSKHPLQPPLVPPPVQFNQPPNADHLQHHTHATRLPPPPPPPPVDISQQMLSLLTRCNDVVTNVKSVLGYVPYHPL